MTGDAGSQVNHEALAAFGLVQVGEAPDRSIRVWSDNWQAVEVFVAMGTQWNVAGMGGPIGLRYESLPAVMRYCGIPAARQREVFGDLRVMEMAALEAVGRGR